MNTSLSHMMTPPREHKAIHDAFLISVWIKGLVGLVQAVAGLLLLLVSPKTIVGLAIAMTTPELSEDPRDPIATFIRVSALHFGTGAQHFASVYLVAHGAIKILLVLALLRGKMWSYPVSIGVLGVFIAYQTYRYTLTHSGWLIALTALDVVVVALVWSEYRTRKRSMTGRLTVRTGRS